MRIVAGPHSGRNAEWIAAIAPPGRGRWLWLLGALQRPLAVAALERAPAPVRERLVIDGLPAGCPCCAAGPQLAAGLARSLRQQRRNGVDVAGLILQVEPEGDPARLADNLLWPEVEAWLRIDDIEAVIGVEELGRDSASASAPARSPRTLRCLGAAARVYVRREDTACAIVSPEATRLGPDWAGALVPVSMQAQAQMQAQGQVKEPARDDGWSVFEHDPFGGLAGSASAGSGAAWQELARWPTSVRFDRRAVPAWLQALGQGLDLDRGTGIDAGAPVELALIARTERDWLGWRPGASEVPLAWRSGSRLAWRPAGRQALPADITDGLAVAPLLPSPG